MHIAEQLRLAGVPTFPCGVRYDQLKRKWAKWPAVPEGESWADASLRAYNDPLLDWSSGVAGVPVPQGIVILDLDLYKGVTREAVDAAMGVALPWSWSCIQTTIGGGEHHAFAVDWPVRQLDSIAGIEGFDTRVAGKGFICTGAGYSPVNFGIMSLAYRDSLPRLPDACRALLEHVAAERPTALPDQVDSAEVAQIKTALSYIDPGCSRSKWIRLAFSLRHHFHNDDATGLDLFERWSAGEFWAQGTPDNYVPEVITAQWYSLKPEGQTTTATIATLYYEAMRSGWQPPVTFDASAAFGAQALPADGYNTLLTEIVETGGDVRNTQALIDKVRAAGCNALQVALLAAELKNALKDAGIKDAHVARLIDGLLTPQTEGKPRQLEGAVPPQNQVLDPDTPLHPSLWAPWQTKGRDMKPKGTHRNFQIMLDAYGVKIHFNEIDKVVHLVGPTVPGGGALKEEACLAWLDSLANLNEYPGPAVRTGLVLEANNNHYNPVEHWISTCVWDGQDHVGALFREIQLEDDEDPVFCEVLFRRWLRGAYAIGTGRLPSWEYVLILMDPYGGAGKTRFFSTLVPHGLFAKSVILELDDKDSIKMAISYWLAELGELDGTFNKSDQQKIKAFLSREYDEMRLAYARAYMKYPRRTAFVATVNEPQFLIDQSNNRRMWVMSVKSVNYQHRVNTHQMWAQVAWEVANGYQAHLTPQEDQLLFARNDAYRVGSGVVDRLSSLSITWGGETDKTMTVTEILALAGCGNANRSELNEAARWLRKQRVPKGRRGNKRGFTLTISGPAQQAFVPVLVK